MRGGTMTLSAPDVGFYQGVVRSWESSTVNTVQVDGAVLPMVTSTEAAFAAGDRVAVLRYKAAYVVIGKIEGSHG